VGDLDGDGTIGLVVGAQYDDDGGTNRGAVYVLDLTGSVVVNSTGDSSDATPGDSVCDTGGTNSEGDPECTLRAAIEEANASATVEAVDFDIPDSDPNHLYYQDDSTGSSLGVEAVTAVDDGSIVDFDPDYPLTSHSWFRIGFASDLPAITAPMTIDGYSQPGATANTVTRPSPSDAVLRIELVGSGVTRGLRVDAGPTTLSGLVVSATADNAAIELASGAGNTVIGNYLGTDPTGFKRGTGSVLVGVDVLSGATGSIIGGEDPASRNIVSANSWAGVRLQGDGATVQGNYIGLDAAGTRAAASGVQDTGIWMESDGNQIGGTATGAANAIGGSIDTGIWGSGTNNSVIEGNLIGTDAAGTSAVANNDTSISLTSGSTGNRIGGVAANAGNLITNTGSSPASAISIAGTTSVDNSILGNSIFANGGLGIDLDVSNVYAGTVTVNDAGDADSGGNDLLNFPVVTGAVESAGTVTVDFDLDAPAGDYRVEVFTNPSGADGTGYGEGEVYQSAATISHTGSGTESFQLTYNGATGDVTTLTATEESAGPVYGSTSEFSLAATVVCADSDSDGLCDSEEDSNTDLDGDPATTPGPDTDGDTTPNYLDSDDDGDGTLTSAENADPNSDGDPRDALDSDWDGEPDYLDAPTTSAGGTVATEQKISDTVGGLTAILDDSDALGWSVAGVGDLDGDGIVDVAVGAPFADD
ncbi:MAG: CSLREA domain-containing protein, partial [Actinomycetia bacterium]|nr:CSLREA domain-containing protein [Actinomycetes bacterium]